MISQINFTEVAFFLQLQQIKQDYILYVCACVIHLYVLILTCVQGAKIGTMCCHCLMCILIFYTETLTESS